MRGGPPWWAVARWWVAASGATGALTLGLPGSALASYHDHGGDEPRADDATEVAAAGNPFSGGLAFDPADVAVEVGDTVRWTNTDYLVPHTATEDNDLWDLGGDYGPPGFEGFGPGELRERRFEAATWSYYCRVHPEEMRGTVAVPVELRDRRARAPRRARAKRQRGPRFNVIARWTRTALPAGQVFDVQRRLRGSWRTVRNGTRAQRMRFMRVREGRRFAIRARVRRGDARDVASGWSPPARLRAGG